MSTPPETKRNWPSYIPGIGLYRRTIGRSYRYRIRQALGRYSARHPSPDMLLIYTSGQVGSSAIEASLEACSDFTAMDTVHHLHYLNPASIAQAEHFNRWHMRRHGEVLPQHLKSLFVRKRLDSGQDLSKVRIITGIRNPLRTLVAGFFQTLYRLPGFDMQRLETPDDPKLLDELQARFVETRDIDYYLDWFDRELQTVFGIDIYAEPFPHDRGFQIYADQQPQLLVLKTEQLGRAIPGAMRAFMDLEGFQLVRDNVAADKVYAGYYQQFLNQGRIPADWVARAEQSRLLQHFYTESERAEILAPWRQNQSR